MSEYEQGAWYCMALDFFFFFIWTQIRNMPSKAPRIKESYFLPIMTYTTQDHPLLCLWQVNKASLPSKSHINSINNTSNSSDDDGTESHV